MQQFLTFKENMRPWQSVKIFFFFFVWQPMNPTNIVCRKKKFGHIDVCWIKMTIFSLLPNNWSALCQPVCRDDQTEPVSADKNDSIFVASLWGGLNKFAEITALGFQSCSTGNKMQLRQDKRQTRHLGNLPCLSFYWHWNLRASILTVSQPENIQQLPYETETASVFVFLWL